MSTIYTTFRCAIKPGLIVSLEQVSSNYLHLINALYLMKSHAGESVLLIFCYCDILLLNNIILLIMISLHCFSQSLVILFFFTTSTY